MNNFKQNNRFGGSGGKRFGGGKSFGGGFKGGYKGGQDSRGGDKFRGGSQGSYKKDFGDSRGGGFGGKSGELFDAVCATCGKKCQVPFRPNGKKPVYCNDCFASQGDRGEYNNPKSDYVKPSFDDRFAFQNKDHDKRNEWKRDDRSEQRKGQRFDTKTYHAPHQTTNQPKIDLGPQLLALATTLEKHITQFNDLQHRFNAMVEKVNTFVQTSSSTTIEPQKNVSSVKEVVVKSEKGVKLPKKEKLTKVVKLVEKKNSAVKKSAQPKKKK